MECYREMEGAMDEGVGIRKGRKLALKRRK